MIIDLSLLPSLSLRLYTLYSRFSLRHYSRSGARRLSDARQMFSLTTNLSLELASGSSSVQRVLPLHDIPCPAPKILNYISKSPSFTSLHCANVLESISGTSAGVSWVSREILQSQQHWGRRRPGGWTRYSYRIAEGHYLFHWPLSHVLTDLP
jgi:hypothetical protein